MPSPTKIRAALRHVRDQLRSGRIKHLPVINKEAKGFKFTMEIYEYQYECGTIACIGGYMGLALWPDLTTRERDVQRYWVMEEMPELKKLFMPPPSMNWAKITPEQTADAIDRFLNDETPW